MVRSFQDKGCICVYKYFSWFGVVCVFPGLVYPMVGQTTCCVLHRVSSTRACAYIL